LKRRAKQLLKYKTPGSKKWDIEKLINKLHVYNSENHIDLFK
jgi:hypothetical protein